MSILVVCRGCHTRFKVADKFAGRKGACPKCKAAIEVPAQEEEVKVHGGELHSGGGKDTKGRLVLKPFEREKANLSTVTSCLIVAGVVFAFGIAFMMRLFDPVPLWVIIPGLMAITPPLVFSGYWFLRDTEQLSGFVGRSLWIRLTVCSLVYAALWAAYSPVSGWSQGMADDIWVWLLIAPPFLFVGAFTAFATFDLDLGTGLLHYALFLLVTILLRLAMGIPLITDYLPVDGLVP